MVSEKTRRRERADDGIDIVLDELDAQIETISEITRALAVALDERALVGRCRDCAHWRPRDQDEGACGRVGDGAACDRSARLDSRAAVLITHGDHGCTMFKGRPS